MIVDPACAAASHPPLIDDRCLRTVFSSMNLGPQLEKPLRCALLVCERQSLGGQSDERGGASRKQHDEQVAFARAFCESDRVARRRHAALVWNWMRRRVPARIRRKRIDAFASSSDQMPHEHRHRSRTAREHRGRCLARGNDVNSARFV